MNIKFKISIIALIIAFTIAFHYGWVWERYFGDIHWLHALHGRFCYIPIVMAAAWFGLRGGIIAAGTVSLLVIPYIFREELGAHSLAGEIVEIIFYFAIAILTGALVERQLKARKDQEAVKLQLEKSHRLSMVGQIAAGVAHEIKNPLASIKGSVEILTEASTSPKDKDEFKEIVFNEIKRIDGTVTDFLDLARPRDFKIEKMNLSELSDATLKQMEIQSSKNNIKIESNIEANLFIPGDKEKIHQVLLNLMLNAIQASKSGDSVKVSLSALNNDAIKLIIKDNGEGIKEEDINKIFDPFFTTKSSGSGLGLALVKTILDKHNCLIDVKSKYNSGTLIDISFPTYKEI